MAAWGVAAEQPNIVLVMPDDMGWGDISAHGHPLLRTPNLDRLYAESVRFNDFHVSPTCAPTRSALLTGRHEFKNGVTHTIQERERLTLEATTLAQVLQTKQYATGIFGKWHLGDEEPYQPHVRGFEETFIHGAGGIGQSYPGSCGDFPGNKYFDPYVRHNQKVVPTKGYCTDVFFQQAITWIRSMQSARRPFFAYITPNAPHAPLVSPGEKYELPFRGQKVGDKPLSPGDIAYYAMIANIDENLGRLLDMLHETGLERDTLVIFLSDNGGTHTRLYSGGFRGSKGQVYHGGTHAPSFWRWPAGFAGGRDCSALAAHIDVFPTLCEILRIPLEGQLATQVEGRSLKPLLTQPNAPWADRELVTHVGRWPQGKASAAKYQNCSIRNQRYRLVDNQELYDLQADPGETRNVISEHDDVVAKLRASYDRWWDDVQPRLVNESAVGPAVNPFRVLYEQQVGPAPSRAKGPGKGADGTTKSGTGKGKE
jgi:arylsulfatase